MVHASFSWSAMGITGTTVKFPRRAVRARPSTRRSRTRKSFRSPPTIRGFCWSPSLRATPTGRSGPCRLSVARPVPWETSWWMARLTPPTEPKSLSPIPLACMLPTAMAPMFANSRDFMLGRLTGLPMAGPYVSRRIPPHRVHISGKSVPPAAIFIASFLPGTPSTDIGLRTAPITSSVLSKTTNKLSGLFASLPYRRGCSRRPHNSPSLPSPMPLLCPPGTGTRSTLTAK